MTHKECKIAAQSINIFCFSKRFELMVLLLLNKRWLYDFLLYYRGWAFYFKAFYEFSNEGIARAGGAGEGANEQIHPLARGQGGTIKEILTVFCNFSILG